MAARWYRRQRGRMRWRVQLSRVYSLREHRQCPRVENSKPHGLETAVEAIGKVVEACMLVCHLSYLIYCKLRYLTRKVSACSSLARLVFLAVTELLCFYPEAVPTL
jgi:hypothetical protein